MGANGIEHGRFAGKALCNILGGSAVLFKAEGKPGGIKAFALCIGELGGSGKNLHSGNGLKVTRKVPVRVWRLPLG